VDSKGNCEKYNVPCLENFDLEVYKKTKPDYLVFGYPLREYSRIEEILPMIQNELVDTIILPDLSFALIGYDITEFNGIPVISINQPKLSNQHIVQKRIFDFVFSGLGLLILSPFLFLISLGVKLSSRGPIFYGQQRVGLDGKVFKMWKFRSMRFEKDAKPGWTIENDPRRTRFGTFLRTTSLDELPQLWNVFVGNMSLVGPRPEQPHFVDEFKNNIPAYMQRHKMKAGITGWAQVNGWRGDTSLISRIDCDIYYIKNWSIWFDVVILFMTFFKGFVNKNAY
jgi:Undecaprenyl-phosphate glucose phosphotransferase